MSPEEAAEKLVEKVSTATLEAVQTLLAAGADPSAKDGDGSTALMVAAANNKNSAVIQVLLAAGADANATNKYGETALSLAAKNNENPDVVKALLAAGAASNVKDKVGETALMWAAWKNGNPKMVKEAGADPNDKDKAGWTPLELARAKGNTAAVKVLAQAVTTQKLLETARSATLEEVRTLFEAGADPNAKNRNGETALLLAAWKNRNPEVVRDNMTRKECLKNGKVCGETLVCRQEYPDPRIRECPKP